MSSSYTAKFTDDQIQAQRDKWLKIGLATGPTDWDKAELGIKLAYEAAKLTPPTTIIKLDSPLQGAIAAQLLSQVGDQVWDQVWVQVRDQVWAQVWDQVGVQVRNQVWSQVVEQVKDQVTAQVGAQVGAQVWAQVCDQVRDQVWAQVWDQVGVQVWDQVWAQVGEQVRAQVRNQVWSQVWSQVGDQVGNQTCRSNHDASYLSYLTMFDKLPEVKSLNGLMMLAESTGWFWPFENLVVMTERPSKLIYQNDKIVYIEYPDGWYATKLSLLDVMAVATG